MSLTAEFERTAQQAKSLPEQPDEVLLELYGLYKQATVGDVSGDAPGMFDFVGRAKYDAWKSREGMDRDSAMRAYIARVGELANAAR